MKGFWARITLFVGVYAGAVAALWGIAEAYTYFTGERLREILGSFWVFVFYGTPLLLALATTVFKRPQELSREELDRFTRDSVDPIPLGPIRRPFHNTGLSDRELRRTIAQRNKDRKPTYLLRMEYNRRLSQRSRQ